LGDPSPDRVSSHAGQEDLAPFKVDEEQDVEPTKCDRVDVEEVTGEGTGHLFSKKLRPRRARRPRRRPKTVAAQEVAYAGGRDGHAELAALAHDAQVAPAGVFPGQAKDEGNDLVSEGVGRYAATPGIGP
jgi:hypothetical protein